MNPYEPPQKEPEPKRHPFELTPSGSMVNLLTWTGAGALLGVVVAGSVSEQLGTQAIISLCGGVAGLIGWSLDRAGR